MFRFRITLENYLKSIQHEDAACEDVSLDDIDMILDLEEEEVKTIEEDIFKLRVSINMNSSLITIPDDFKDDKETHRHKEGSYHESATKKFMDIVIDIVKRKMGASEVVFSEAIVPAETFTYHKLMGPESSGRIKGVRSRVTSNQLNAKCNCQRGTKPSDSSIVSLLLKEVRSLCQEGDDVEENQRNNTPLAAKNNEAYIKDISQIENSTVLRNKGGAAHASRSPHVSQQRQSVGGKENIQSNSLQGVNKSYTSQIGKKHISVTNRMENSTIDMPRPHDLVNQSDDQKTSTGGNTNTSDCSKQLNITRKLHLD
ncbi:hypothetical protein Cgig2_011618 [Carnegiea gigantea]|uniref:Uncharacterized protein n=1 Tax=Carnegiea gigantea TaxID=171969 RepID=A0A9Q1GNA0_9CARY|nr:hypothetical protein Cgig2_011618 [Carnegiea gigantea]